MTPVSRTALLPVPVAPKQVASNQVAGPRPADDPERLTPIQAVRAIEAQARDAAQSENRAQRRLPGDERSFDARDFERQSAESKRSKATAAYGWNAGPVSGVSAQGASGFVVHLLGQQETAAGGQDSHDFTPSGDQPRGFAQYGAVLTKHRDGLALGSAIYRRAGGEPEIFSQNATLLRLAV